jgi:hypothetical protein
MLEATDKTAHLNAKNAKETQGYAEGNKFLNIKRRLKNSLIEHIGPIVANA